LMRRYGAAPLQPDMRGNTPLDLSRHAAVRPAVPHEAGRGEVYTLLAPLGRPTATPLSGGDQPNPYVSGARFVAPLLVAPGRDVGAAAALAGGSALGSIGGVGGEANAPAREVWPVLSVS